MILRLMTVLCFLAFFTTPVDAGSRDEVIKKLNTLPSTGGDDSAKSWKIFFDACLQMTPPPQPLSDTFNMNTVWPGMEGWSEVSNWARDNEHMTRAFVESGKLASIGFPYGSEHVPSNYVANNVVAEIGVGGNLHISDFGYIQTVEVACLWVTAELYRLFEEEEIEQATQLLMSELIVLRKFCDREFLKEQMSFMPMLGDALSNTRDMFYTYRESISPTQFRFFARDGIPYIRTDPTRLLMPEGDRFVGESLLGELFTSNGTTDSEQFRTVLTDIQSSQEKLSRFGAAKYWESIAVLHLGRDDSLARLNKIYNDWWRRWKLRQFHPQLSVASEFKKSNPVKYAAVNMIIRDIQDLFFERDLLATQVNGTAVSAALCGYKNHYGVYPASVKMMYAQLLHRANNLDMFRQLTLRTEADWSLYTYPVGALHYRKIDKKTKIKVFAFEVFVQDGQCLLYSESIDNEDDRGLDGGEDLIFWPPLKMLQRNAGQLK